MLIEEPRKVKARTRRVSNSAPEGFRFRRTLEVRSRVQREGTRGFTYRVRIPMVDCERCTSFRGSGVRAGWVASVGPRPQGRRSVGR